jgi:hypothetical protein
MLGFGKAKPAEKKSQAQAFEEFKATVIAAVHEAKNHAVWDVNLGDWLEHYAGTLDARRRM